MQSPEQNNSTNTSVSAVGARRRIRARARTLSIAAAASVLGMLAGTTSAWAQSDGQKTLPPRSWFELQHNNPTQLTPISPSQSSTGWGGTAGRAVDDNFNQAWSGRSVTHTKREQNPWWEADFAAPYYGLESIEVIRILGRDDDCCVDRLNNVWVFVSAGPFTSDDPQVLANDPNVDATFVQMNTANPQIVVTPNIDLRRYAQGDARVRVQIEGYGILSLAEVQVFGTFENT